MAATLPDSRFVGCDLAPTPIRLAREATAALGLRNVEWFACDFRELPADLGPFDYIIAHGVYSWVPNPVQERLLAICARQLGPAGIAYVSYNTLPGWRMRGVVRDAMTYHTRGIAEPATRVAQARAVLEFLAESVRDDASAYGSALRAEAELLRKQADYYILHDHLEEVNEPLYFHQFIERAARHGLGYLGEANFAAMLAPATQKVTETPRALPLILSSASSSSIFTTRERFERALVHSGVPLTRGTLSGHGTRVASNARRP
jgi:SAM-dependent methyltransferase